MPIRSAVRTQKSVQIESLEPRVVFATTGAFTDSAVISGLVAPVAAKIAPDGRIFVAERSGIIKVFDRAGDTTPTVFADLRAKVHNAFDRGLLGLTLDPKFTTGRPYVYVLYTYDGDIGGPAPKFGTATSTTDPAPNATSTGALASGRLSRLTASGDIMVAGSEKVLVADWKQQFPSHSVGSVAFGPDGSLYASAGDAANFHNPDYGQFGNPFNDPTNQGGALRAQDLLTSSDPAGLDGSVIRVNPDTGAASASNPYANSIDKNKARVIAFGLRNPFRFTFRPGTNELWVGDVGWNEQEEIDRIPAPADATVENFGWPAYEGYSPNKSFQNAGLPLLQTLYDDSTKVTKPYYAYKHNERVVAGSNEPIGGSSVTGLAFYDGGAYPDAYDGAFFFADYSRKQIYVMYKGPDGLPDQSTRSIFKATAGGATQLFTGPGGDLYYIDNNGGALRKFTYTAAGANRSPTAKITADKTGGAAPLTVQFSAASSTDPDGDALKFAWDLDGDGAYDDSTSAAPNLTYTTVGTKTIGLKVTDAKGAFGTAAYTLRVGDNAPAVTITTPTTTTNWSVGQAISFGATATDSEDGTLPASAYVWTLDLLHDNLIDPASSHVHQIRTFEGVKSGSFVAPDHEYPSRLRLTLTVTDSSGAKTAKTIILQPRTVKITLASDPAGIELSVDGTAHETPEVITAIAGASTTISAPPAQIVGGVEYRFAGWASAGSTALTISATEDRTVKALYDIYAPPGSLPRVQAENFNTGGQNVGYFDNEPKNLGGKYRTTEGVDIESTTDAGGGYNVAYVRSGEWLRYDVNVTQAGTFTLLLRVATSGTGARVKLTLDGKAWTGNIALPDTGGNQNWQTVIFPNLPMKAGKHTIRLSAVAAVAGGVSVANLNWFQLLAPPPTYNTMAARALTATYASASIFTGSWIAPRSPITYFAGPHIGTGVGWLSISAYRVFSQQDADLAYFEAHRPR